MNGITYYRLKSDYPGDYTKNCALNGSEVDNNFYVLEGRDVKSIGVKDNDIVVTLMNGDKVTAEGVLDFVKSSDIQTGVVNVEFDTMNGILKLKTLDGNIQYIEGFATNENTNFSVATDNTLCGDGLRNAPLGVAPSARTGQYKSVKRIIDIASGSELPSCGNVRGDRYLTIEDVSDYGYLYDYRAVRKIASEIKTSGWRVPTKEDWDNLLNAVEPCDCDRTHGKSDTNKILGKWAGKLLKSKTMWKECGCGGKCDSCGCGSNHYIPSCDCNNNCGSNTCFNYDDDTCSGTSECGCETKCCDDSCCDNRGLDAFGFRATPAGYSDDGCNYGYFRERAAFWTATTNSDNSKAYIKRFQYNSGGVYQDIIASTYHLSLRLVKDYNGKNYFDTESILDMEYPTLLLPSQKHGKMIWMASNLACGNASFCPMLPNNGQNLTYTRHYFINEWDGFRWVRNEMKQGDTVTVEKAPKAKKLVEYRVVGDDLVSVNDMIYNDVMKDVSIIIDDTKTELNNRIDTVEQKVDIETNERCKADEKLQTSIEALDEKIDKTNEDLAAEVANREAEDKKLSDRIDTTDANLLHTNQVLKDFSDETNNAFVQINNVIKTSVDTINQSIMNETDARIKADEALQLAIDKEAEERKKGDEEHQEQSDERYNELKEKINENKESIGSLEVKTDKTNEDLATVNNNLATAITNINVAIKQVNDNLVDAVNTINGGIATEIQDRKDADQALDDKIEVETVERKSEDEEIRGTILTSEGTEFDKDNGILTLKSKDGTNDIDVQFTFNFGEFGK